MLRRMTLLCLVMTDDAVLFSADSAANSYELDPRFLQPFPAVVPRKKVLPTGTSTVMWGYSGFQKYRPAGDRLGGFRHMGLLGPTVR
jgi:hypothetical protein